MEGTRRDPVHRYPLAWPPEGGATPADLVALSIATWSGSRHRPYLWWSTRSDCAPRLGRADPWLDEDPLPLPPVAMWPDEARGWLVGELLATMSPEEAARVVPYALWPAAERDRLAWQLRHERGLSAAEAGQILGITGRAVNMALVRHRDRS